MLAPVTVTACSSDRNADPAVDEDPAFTVTAPAFNSNVLVQLVPIEPEAVLSTIVLPERVTPLSVNRFVAESALMLYVPAAEFGLGIFGQHANVLDDGVITFTVPLAVSSTYTEPLPEVAEKLAAENVTGELLPPTSAFTE